jgi:SAM-dependent methyltransferase
MITRADRFSETAVGYAATMAPSLRPVAAEVVRRVALAPNEDVLDIGTGTGIAAAAARGAGRRITGIDAAPGMLAIARDEVDDVAFEEMDFMALRRADATFDVVLATHSLLFAADRIGALREWLRVTRPGGRLSVSVPGPNEASPTAVYAAVYERFGIGADRGYPSREEVAGYAVGAGWADVAVDSDPDVAIRLPDEDAFRTWRAIGSRDGVTARFTQEEHDALTDAMLAVTPRAPDGTLRIPFGAIYLTARRPPA